MRTPGVTVAPDVRPEIAAMFAEMRQKGVSCERLGQRANIPSSTIRKWAAGFEPKDALIARCLRELPSVSGVADAQEPIRDCLRQGMSLRATERRCGWSLSVVRRIHREMLTTGALIQSGGHPS